MKLRPTTPDDAIANLLVYLPVGLILGLMAMRGLCGRCAGVLLAVGIGATLSILVETLQTGLVSRVASCTDVLLNGVGTAIGACLGVGLSGSAQAAMIQVRSELADRPFTTAASLLTVGLFVYNLVPFDFVMSTDALHASFGRANWSLMSAGVTTFGAPPFAAMAHQLSVAGWFAVLGYLLALRGFERGRHPATSLGSALKDGLILAALVGFMQLFSRSHAFDTATMLIRGFGVAFGAWFAVSMIDPLAESARHCDGLQVAQPLTGGCADGLAVPTIYMSHNYARVVMLMAILALLQIGLLIAPCVNPQGGSFSSDRPFAGVWLPFEALSRQSLHAAAANILSTLLTFGTLTLTLVALLRRIRVVYVRWWATGAMIMVSITCEGLRLTTLGTSPDVTTLLLVLAAAYFVTTFWSAVDPSVWDSINPRP